MCGIAGFHLPDPRQDRDAILGRMLQRLARRGPDSEGVFRAGDCFLGHRRLSIVDLSPQGNQPMLNEDGTLALVCNGELYGYHDLRKELEDKGHRFLSQSDSEVILHLYEEEGPDCVRRLRGMFAFAILDARTGRFFLARDRFGVKPLYWTHGPRGFAFASELHALLAFPVLGSEIDLHALSRYLCFYYVPAPSTILRGVHALEPGHTLTVEGDRLDLRAYWRPEWFLDHAAAGDRFDRRAYEDEVDTALAESVRVHLNADVPVGAFLSGGVDSSGVVAYMSRFVEGARTFCLVQDDPSYDERVYAAEVARRFATEHVEVPLNAGQGFDVSLLDFLTEIYGEPFASPSAIAVHSVIQAMKGRVKCVLSGDGADELFAGYDQYMTLERLRRLQRLVPRPLAQGVRALERWLRFPQGRRLASAMKRVDWGILEFILNEKSFFSFGEQSELLSDEALARLDLEREALYLNEKLALPDHRASPENLYRFMVLQQLTDYMLTKVDRASMGHSVEVRVPYVDHVVYELLCRAPASEKFDPTMPKPILKRVLARYLPQEILHRPKKGFAVHLEQFVGGAFRDHVRELLLDAGTDEFFRRDAVEGLMRRLEDGALAGNARVKTMYRLWTVAIFLHWRCHVLTQRA